MVKKQIDDLAEWLKREQWREIKIWQCDGDPNDWCLSGLDPLTGSEAFFFDLPPSFAGHS